LADPLDLGSDAPRIALLDQEGQPADWDKLLSTRYTLVYFYPKADTPGCTKQACSLRDAFAELTDKGITVVGVSGDSPEKQKAFKEKHTLPFTLLSDTKAEIMAAYGVPHVGPVSKRQAFLFENGKLIWRDIRGSTAKQAQDVLEEIAARQAH
jgi:peroxiredoxin Q/BCP